MTPTYSTKTITQTPLIEEAKVREFLRNFYGISDCRIHKLTGYDDLNFRIEECRFGESAHADLKSRGETVFVAKFMNPLEAANPDLLDGQQKLAECLRAHGIPCPEALPTVNGDRWQIVAMTEKVKAPLRLFNFLPGKMVEAIGYEPQVFRVLGTLLAKFHNATVDFRHPAYDSGHRHFMCMENWDALEAEFRLLKSEGFLKEPERIRLCERAFADLRNDVLEHREKFSFGLIHSDFNETNVLLRKKLDAEIEVTGLLDLGDSHRSLILFDLAALVLYMAVDAKVPWHDVQQSVLEGYNQHRTPTDLSHLLVAMRARLTSSLVYSLRTVRINFRGEDPTYVLKMQAAGWNSLADLTRDYDEMQLKNKE